MRAIGVVVHAPRLNSLSGFWQGSKPFLVETFAAKGAVEGLNMPVLHGLSRFDEEQGHLVLRRPDIQHLAPELWPGCPFMGGSMRSRFGTPRRAICLSKTRTTRSPLKEVSLSIARHCRVKVSRRFKVRKERLSAKASWMKSKAHSSLGACAGCGTHRPRGTRPRF